MAIPSLQSNQQFLSSVLSLRNPAALPYSDDTKWLIRQHLPSLTSTFPSLELKTAAFIHNDGRTVNLLQADGTIPTAFQGMTYNTPVVIWLMESYPRHPPCVYVNPTRDMIIKRGHRHVNPSGLVSSPYLRNWIYPSSNLVDLVCELSLIFGQEPPVYSQRKPNPDPNHHPSHNYSSVSSNLREYPPRVQPEAKDQAEVFKRNLINKLAEMVLSDIIRLGKAREGDMEGTFNVQAVLRRREERINLGLKEMKDEREGLEQQLQMGLMNADVLEAWLRENEGKTLNFENLEVEDAFDCVDKLSKQMLECTSSDVAIEDVIYSLDQAAQDGAMPFDQYLRNVRLLSREQFFHKATAAKVRAVQMRAYVASMAARAPRYG